MRNNEQTIGLTTIVIYPEQKYYLYSPAACRPKQHCEQHVFSKLLETTFMDHMRFSAKLTKQFHFHIVGGDEQ